MKPNNSEYLPDPDPDSRRRKLPPHSLEAEQGAIACALLDPLCMTQMARLPRNTFYDRDSAAASSATGTSSQAVNTRGDSNVTTSAYGGSGNIQSLGSTTVAGNKGDVTITTADPAVLRDALAQVTSLADGAARLFSTSQDKTNALVTTLAETKQTDGAAATNRNLVYVSLAALTVLGVVFYRRS